MAESVWYLPFGTFAGKGIEDVPNKYLEYLLEQDWFCDKFSDKIELLVRELKYREDFNVTIEWGDEE